MAVRIIFTFFLLSLPVHAQQYGWVKVAQVGGIAAMDFSDSMHGVAGGFSAYYYTKDGGLNWQQGTRLGTTFTPFAISMIDTSIGWSSGWIGTGGGPFDGGIAHTTDGGVTWVTQLYVNDRQYLGVSALTNSRVIVSGYYRVVGVSDTGKIVETTSGGSSWTEKSLGDTLPGFGKVLFIDSLHGWMTAGVQNRGPAILRTIDGGSSWTVILTPQGFYGLSFIDTLSGWGAYGGNIYRTVDGGVNWQQVGYIFDPDPFSSSELYTNALSFVDSLNGWAFGRTVFHSSITEGIYRTTDGGFNWFRESIGLTPDISYATDGEMLSLQLGWAGCSDGSVLRYQITTDVVEKLPDIPHSFSLQQNYPNPFNPITNIEYEIIHQEHVSVTVEDAIGRKIRTLVNQLQAPGVYKISFDATSLASGIYYYTLTAGRFVQTKQMLLLK